MPSLRKPICCLLVIVCLLTGVFHGFSETTDFIDDPDAIEAAIDSVVMLEVSGADAQGSGFALFDSHIIVTNYHVIEDGTAIKAIRDDKTTFKIDYVLVADKDRDIALLYTNANTNMKPFEFSLDKVKRGSKVIAIGSPEGLTNTVSMGIISNSYIMDGVDIIQHTAPISHGSSGGVLLNAHGTAIGVNSMMYVEDDAQNINLSVNISEVVYLYEHWDGEKYSIRNYKSAKPSVFVQRKADTTVTIPAPNNKITNTPTKFPIPWQTKKPSVTLKPTATPKPTKSPTPQPTKTPGPTTSWFAFQWSTKKPLITSKPTAVPTKLPISSPVPTPIFTSTPQVINRGEKSTFSIVFSEYQYSLLAGQKEKLKPIVQYDNGKIAANLNFNWSSSDKSVAKVNDSGTVTAVGAGDAVITCSSIKDKTVFTRVFIHVGSAVQSVKLNVTEATLYVNAAEAGKNSIRLTADVFPADAACKTVKWQSSDRSVAIVDENGNVTAVSVGTATITATSMEEGTEKPKKATCKIRVNKAVESLSSETKDYYIKIGKTQKLTPTLKPSNASNKKLIWTSTDKSIATVSSDGVVSAKKLGTCQIICKAADENGAFIVYTVYIIQPVTKITVKQKNITVEKNSKTLDLFDYVNIEPIDATKENIIWTINGTKWKDSYYSPTKIGTYKVKATSIDGSNLSASFTINVTPPKGTCTLYITDKAWDGCEIDLTNHTFKTRIEVANMETAKKITSFEIYIYATDEYGNNTLGANNAYSCITVKNVKGGSVVYSDYVYLPSIPIIYGLHFGIHKVTYEDGTVITVPNIEYHHISLYD